MQMLTALFMVALPLASAQGVMQRTMLPDAMVESLGARCMDGSAGGYFYLAGKGANASRLVLYIQGGGECRTLEECQDWYATHASNSSQWAATMPPEAQSEMDTDCEANPDFCTWSKVFIPYCTGDMHSGTQMERNAALGGYYFAGHNTIAGVAQHLTSSHGMPSMALIVGSSAGGIAALMHTDFFGEQWPAAVVKGSPMCGFFYAGVTASNDFSAGRPTPAAHLGFIPEWKPYLPSACAAATGDNVSLCTDAHYLYPHLKQPLFIRENQYDTAKLGNCGWDQEDASYLKEWGAWMRAQLAVIAMSPKDGYFSGSCLEHGGNFGWLSSPVINGVHMREAVANWFFERGDAAMQYTLDNCSVTSGSGLPCTKTDAELGQRCPLWQQPAPAQPLTPACEGALSSDCPGLKGKGAACGTCVRAHVQDLRGHGCPATFEAVFSQWCQAPPALPPRCEAELQKDCPGLRGKGQACGKCVRGHHADLLGHACPSTYEPVYDQWCSGSYGRLGASGPGHHVCDLSQGQRVRRFGY